MLTHIENKSTCAILYLGWECIWGARVCISADPWAGAFLGFSLALRAGGLPKYRDCSWGKYLSDLNFKTSMFQNQTAQRLSGTGTVGRTNLPCERNHASVTRQKLEGLALPTRCSSIAAM